MLWTLLVATDNRNRMDLLSFLTFATMFREAGPVGAERRDNGTQVDARRERGRPEAKARGRRPRAVVVLRRTPRNGACLHFPSTSSRYGERKAQQTEEAVSLVRSRRSTGGR